MRELLARVVQATAAATDGDDLLARVAALVVEHVDWVLADRLDEPDLVHRVAARTRDGVLALPTAMGAEQARRSSAGAVGLLPRLQRVPSRLLHLDAAALEAVAAGPEVHAAVQARTALALGSREVVLLGLVARDATLGVLTLGRASGFDPQDLADLRSVALHVGTALDAVRLLAVQRAVATAMQTSLLPPLPAVAGLRLAARYVPAARGLDVGGDWYDAFVVRDELVLVVGDVRGHDLAAAARMADLRNLLRAHAVDRDEAPSALVSRLERTTEVLGLDAAATCVAARLTAGPDGTWRLRWTSAGHLPPVLLSGGRARLLETEADLMLGVDAGSPRTDHEQVLVRGDVLVLCTDGLVEVRDASLDDGLEALRASVEAADGSGPDALAERLLIVLSGCLADDVALLVVEVAA